MNTTSVTLLARLRQPGEEDAWARFVELYTPLLYYWACRLGLQADDAADLVQDVFTTLVTKLPEFTYERDKSFRNWLRTVTRNRWRDVQRRRANSELKTNTSDVYQIADPDPAEVFWERDYREHLVARALELMRAEFRPSTWQACWETVVSGRPATEVATRLGMSVDAVYTAKSRVLRRLRQQLDGLLE
jgi:RNA polymerase sigma-70 factor (ECF subfamily)